MAAKVIVANGEFGGLEDCVVQSILTGLLREEGNLLTQGHDYECQFMEPDLKT